MGSDSTSRVPAGSFEETLWEAYVANRSSELKQKLFSHYAVFARDVARSVHRKLYGNDIELYDSFQMAYAGLLEAIARYKPELGVPFRPFASHRIAGSVRDGIAHATERREQISWLRRLRRERARSLSDTGAAEGSPGALERLSEIVSGLALGFALEDAGLMNLTDDERPSGKYPCANAYDNLAWRELILRLQAEMVLLPAREQTILRLHYLDGVSFDDLASMLAVSKGRVSQVHRSALLLLRKRLVEHGHRKLGNLGDNRS